MRKARISLVIWHRVFGKKVLITESKWLREGFSSTVLDDYTGSGSMHSSCFNSSFWMFMAGLTCCFISLTSSIISLAITEGAYA
jgi:NADH:ubiquinone oxidoreductase subunit B-like Fe-S oxidoreductase